MTKRNNLSRPAINLIRRKVSEYRADLAEAPVIPLDMARGSESDASEDLDDVESSAHSTDIEVHLQGGLDSDEEPFLGPQAIVNMPARTMQKLFPTCMLLPSIFPTKPITMCAAMALQNAASHR